MKKHKMGSLVAAAAIAVIATSPRTALAQTAAELMQKGIYTQETAGDLDGAIAIYRQIVNSGSSPRDLAAQAQYRIAQSLLQKGDLGTAATEFSSLARNYADYGRLVSSMAAQARGAMPFSVLTPSGGPALGRQLGLEILDRQNKLKEAARTLSGHTPDAASMAQIDAAKAQLAEMQAKLAAARAAASNAPAAGLYNGVSFDGGAPLTVRGVVMEVLWVNPVATIMLDPQDGSGKKYAFQITSPNAMVKREWTRQTAKLNDQFTITGVLAVGNQTIRPDVFVARADTVTAADGSKLFDRTAIQK